MEKGCGKTCIEWRQFYYFPAQKEEMNKAAPGTCLLAMLLFVAFITL
jgi:hypothetical protein